MGTVRIIVDRAFAVRLSPFGHLIRLEVGAEWSGLPRNQQLASLCHELLHLSCRHPLRGADCAFLPLWGLACDLVVNQFMEIRDLPNSVSIRDFPGLGRDKSAEEYYRLLLPVYSQCIRGDCRLPTDEGDGGCPDNPTSGALDTMKAWLGKHPTGNHGTWPEFADLGSATLSVLDTNIHSLLQSSVLRTRQKGWGRLSTTFIEYLDQLLFRRPQVPWRRVLRMFGATSSSSYIRNTLARPSKRYGTSPGIRVQRRRNLVVAVDTSGSVNLAALIEFFSEIHSL